MTDIDHKAEALESIDCAKERESVDHARLLLEDGLLHATLYLAEQQRIANLIAYSEALAENQREGYVLNDQGRARVDLMERLIVEGLGI